MTPDFDDLVDDLDGEEERERLRRVHDLLLAAGPPPELTPKLAEPKPPTADILQFPKRRHAAAAIAAAAIAVVAFGGGYLIGNTGGGDEFAARGTVTLSATSAAPQNARASIKLGERDEAGNWQMIVTVGGLPKLESHAYYRLWLQHGKRVTLPCGDFVVDGTDDRATVRFTVSYEVESGDRWIVAYQAPGKHEMPGRVVLST